jgi:hypothetical protein
MRVRVSSGGRRLRSIVAAAAVGCVAVAVLPAAPAQAALAPIFTLDKARQIVLDVEAGGVKSCLQFVNAEPSYVTLAPCLPMPASYAQLWTWSSVTNQISVTLPQNLGGARLCLTTVEAGLAGPDTAFLPTPLLIKLCGAASPISNQYLQTWTYEDGGYSFYRYAKIQSKGTGRCLSTWPTSGGPGSPLTVWDCFVAYGGWRTLEPTWPVGGFVWADANHDGIKDVTEIGIGGVRVHLLDASGSQFVPDISMLTSTNTQDGNLGRYQFNDVHPGTYRVKVDLPSGSAATIKNAPNSSEATDSDVDATGTTDQVVVPEPDVAGLQPGPELTKINAGVIPA